jgi:hypothetical protein
MYIKTHFTPKDKRERNGGNPKIWMHGYVQIDMHPLITLGIQFFYSERRCRLAQEQYFFIGPISTRGILIEERKETRS